MTRRLLYLVSHPIQYQAPLLRRIAGDPDIELSVIFADDFSASAYLDAGFGVEVAWDVPLREGYENACLDQVDLAERLGACDALWLHGWQGPAMRRALKLAQGLDRPVLMRGENWSGAMPDGWGPRKLVKRRYLDHIFRRCAAFLAIGQANRAYYLDHGVPEARIFSMPYAVDNAFFRTRAEAADISALRRSLGLAEGVGVVLFAGKLTRRKRPDLLLDAWARAQWAGGNRPALLFVGDGELRTELEAKAPAGVHFTGFRNQTELPAFHGLADLFVLPSEREPWGLAVNEAMACATGVIATDQCGAAFDLIDDTTGRVVPAGDVDALARVLPDALADARALGAGAARRIASWDFEADLVGLKAGLEAVA